MKNLRKINKIKLLSAILLILLGSLGRIFLLDYPNIETLTVVSLLAGTLLGGIYGPIVALSTVALTDMYIGNQSILFFTWSAWASISLFGFILHKKKKDTFKFSAQLTVMGLLSSVFFYIWTNLGVWLLFNMYPKTFTGLIQCYTMAIPFFKANLFSNLIIVGATSISIVLALKIKRIYLNNKNTELKPKTN